MLPIAKLTGLGVIIEFTESLLEKGYTYIIQNRIIQGVAVTSLGLISRVVSLTLD
jgi:hypothetical protein